MTTTHWKFNATDVDLKDYGRNKPGGPVSKENGAFPLTALPASYANHLTITESTVYTLYEFMDYIKGL
jgi:hypothetical protein